MIKVCLIVFIFKVIEISLGTMRTLYTVKRKKIFSAIFAFIEVLIWYMVAKIAINISGNAIIIGIIYALGYSVGTIIGVFLSNVLMNNYVSIMIITKKNNHDLIDIIKKNGYGASLLELKCNKQKEMIIVITHQKEIKKIISLVNSNDNKAFITINETKTFQNGFIK